MSELIAHWRGSTWTAMLTREPYGYHFSVGANGRPPTDDEVDAAFVGHQAGLWVEEKLHEVTQLRAESGDQINPWVRQFVPESQAQTWRQLVAEKRAGGSP